MTGLVYVAIVALWAAVLIPMWLRRHDDDQARRIDRHSSAMGTLERMSTSRSAAASAASRRRRTVLIALALVASAAVGAWILGLLPTVVTAIAFLPLLAYSAIAAIAVRRVPVAATATRTRRERAVADGVAVGEHAVVGERAVGDERDVVVERDVVGQHAVAPAADRSLDVGTPGEVATERSRTPRHARPAVAAWDDVFDQSA